MMKLLRSRRIVQYFGIDIFLNDGFHWVATDQNGEVFAFRSKPVVNNFADGRHWLCTDPPSSSFAVNTANLEFVAEVDLEGVAWQESLQFYE